MIDFDCSYSNVFIVIVSVIVSVTSSPKKKKERKMAKGIQQCAELAAKYETVLG